MEKKESNYIIDEVEYICQHLFVRQKTGKIYCRDGHFLSYFSTIEKLYDDVMKEIQRVHKHKGYIDFLDIFSEKEKLYFCIKGLNEEWFEKDNLYDEKFCFNNGYLDTRSFTFHKYPKPVLNVKRIRRNWNESLQVPDTLPATDACQFAKMQFAGLYNDPSQWEVFCRTLGYLLSNKHYEVPNYKIIISWDNANLTMTNNMFYRTLALFLMEYKKIDKCFFDNRKYAIHNYGPHANLYFANWKKDFSLNELCFNTALYYKRKKNGKLFTIPFSRTPKIVFKSPRYIKPEHPYSKACTINIHYREAKLNMEDFESFDDLDAQDLFALNCLRHYKQSLRSLNLFA